jgi:hypothetical protein
MRPLLLLMVLATLAHGDASVGPAKQQVQPDNENRLRAKIAMPPSGLPRLLPSVTARDVIARVKAVLAIACKDRACGARPLIALRALRDGRGVSVQVDCPPRNGISGTCKAKVSTPPASFNWVSDDNCTDAVDDPCDQWDAIQFEDGEVRLVNAKDENWYLELLGNAKRAR